MPIQIQGNGGTVAEVDGTQHRAQRITPKPIEALGHYSFGGHTGILPAALAANSEIFQFRWSDATKLCVLRRIRISASVSTTFFAAGVPVQIDLIKSTAWTVAGTGGTGLTPAALLKRRSDMDSSVIPAGDVRIASTAALGAGTKTLEGTPIAALNAAGPITASLAGTIIPPGTPLFEAEPGDGGYPMVLLQNQGLSIRSNAVPATGTWTLSVSLDWAEVSAY